VRVVDDPNRAIDLLAQDQTVTHLLMDMRLASDALLHALEGRAVQAAAFGPHVEGRQLLELKRQGVSAVWPNSRLLQQLAAWLS
jgi:hypothetical protein